MSNDVTTSQQTAPETVQAPSITDEKLSFSDYERLRRGESLPAAPAAAKSAPEAPKASEQKESEESDTSETEESEDAKSEVEDHESEADDEAKEVDKPAGKKKGGFQRRIDKLNARNAAIQQEAEYWKQMALKSAGAPKEEAPKVETAKADASAKPSPDKYETHAEYVEAIADWKAEQKLKERDEREAKARQQTEAAKVVQSYIERKEAFAKTAADYDEVIAEVDDIPLSPTVREIILSSDNGPALAYELAKNREEYARVCKLSPLAAAREMGRIEARISAKSSEAKKPEPKKLTQAPKPIDPVGAAKSAPVMKSPEDMSFAEYEKFRREQLKRRRG